MYRVCKPKPAPRDDKARRTCRQLEDAAERAHTVVVLMLERRGGCQATGSSSCSSNEGENYHAAGRCIGRIVVKRKQRGS